MGQQRTYSWEGTAADGAVTGERRTASVSDQPGSSGDPQFVVCRARSCIESEGKRRLYLPRLFPRPPEIDRPHNAQEQVAHLERLCGQQALERGSLRSEVDVLKKAWHWSGDWLPSVP